MEWMEAAAKILAGWVALSLILAAGWSRFIGHVRSKEQDRSAAASAQRLIEFSPASAEKRAS